MAEFFTQLFESIFIAGPTPSLVLATNVSFAALQVLLLTLVIATYNVHFMILSFLSAGLWWSVNWFVRELGDAREKEQEKEELKKRKKGKDGDGAMLAGVGGDSETETEDGTGVRENIRLRVPSQQMKQGRTPSSASASASASGTDSEWDKVEVDDE